MEMIFDIAVTVFVVGIVALLSVILIKNARQTKDGGTVSGFVLPTLPQGRFRLVQSSGSMFSGKMEIYVDTRTGVEYLLVIRSGSIAVTPMPERRQ